MNKELISAIEKLDVAAVLECMKGNTDLTSITLDFVIEQYGVGNEEKLYSRNISQEETLKIYRRIDTKKAAIVKALIKAGIRIDEDCLLNCNMHYFPKTLEVILANGANPNPMISILKTVRHCLTLRDEFGEEFAIIKLLSESEQVLLNYGAVEYRMQCCNFIDFCPKMIVMMGLQGAGKTSFCKMMFPNGSGYRHVSLDELKTRKRESLVLQECYKNYRSCIIDNTNPTKSDRQRYINPARQLGFRIIGYFMQSKLSDCLERNEKRDRQVPKKGILATFNKMEMPSLDEGFDELNFVSIENGEFKISKWIEDEI